MFLVCAMLILPFLIEIMEAYDAEPRKKAVWADFSQTQGDEPHRNVVKADTVSSDSGKTRWSRQIEKEWVKGPLDGIANPSKSQKRRER